MKLFKNDGCEQRRFTAPCFDLRCFKGDSSSQANPTINNNQVAVDGNGMATGASTASGANSASVSAANSTATSTNLSNSKGSSYAAPGGNSNVITASGTSAVKVITNNTTNTTTDDPELLAAALNANANLATNAIASATALTAGNATIFSTALTNFGTLISQGISAFTSSQPQVAQLATAPANAGPTFIYAGTGSALASGSPSTTPAATSDTVDSLPAAPAAATGLSNGEMIGIAGLAIGALALIYVLKD